MTTAGKHTHTHNHTFTWYYVLGTVLSDLHVRSGAIFLTPLYAREMRRKKVRQFAHLVTGAAPV